MGGPRRSYAGNPEKNHTIAILSSYKILTSTNLVHRNELETGNLVDSHNRHALNVVTHRLFLVRSNRGLLPLAYDRYVGAPRHGSFCYAGGNRLILHPLRLFLVHSGNDGRNDPGGGLFPFSWTYLKRGGRTDC
jgi:hypothetical protein